MNSEDAQIGVRVAMPQGSCSRPQATRGVVESRSINGAVVRGDCGCHVWWPYSALTPLNPRTEPHDDKPGMSAADILLAVADRLERRDDSDFSVRRAVAAVAEEIRATVEALR